MIRQKIRVVAPTPELAAQAIREKLGRAAEVVSIRSIQPTGWGRWFQRHQIEVIAGIPEPFEDDIVSEISSTRESMIPSPLLERGAWNKVQALFEQAGFGEDFPYNASVKPDWKHWETLPIAEAFLSVKHWLINCYTQLPKNPLMQRVAFLGPTGSGSTTALGKFLAKNYFDLPGLQVLKLDREEANADEPLKNFCELFGIYFAKDPVDLPYVDLDKNIWIDVPGIGLKQPLWDNVKSRLDALSVDTRILVIHSGYDKECLSKLGNLAQRIGITHFVFSHWDEVDTALHLWPFILKQGIQVLGLSEGADLTGQWKKDALPFLLEKTLPL